MTSTPRFMPMIGDSMVPTVGPGDLVAVLPTSEFRGEGLYVIDVAGEPNVVRVQSMGNGMLGILYDHPAYNGRAMLAADLPDALLGKVFAICRVVCPRTAAAAGMAVAPLPIAIQGGTP